MVRYHQREALGVCGGLNRILNRSFNKGLTLQTAEGALGTARSGHRQEAAGCTGWTHGSDVQVGPPVYCKGPVLSTGTISLSQLC